MDDLPILILELLPGIINLLQFLQKRIWYSNGNFTLYLNIIFFAVACGLGDESVVRHRIGPAHQWI